MREQRVIMTKIVIIGGVAGGATAAARLRRLDEDAEIIVLEKGDYVSYANCGLPYHLGGVIEKRGNLLLQTPEGFFSRYRVEVRLGNEALAIDAAARTVQVRRLATGEIYEEGYDELILSPGGRPALPPADEGAAGRIFTLHTLADMDLVAAYIEEFQPRDVVILGGGFIGIEAAENLIERGLRVTLVQRSGQIFAPFDPEMAKRVQAELVDNGVELLLDSPLEGISVAGGAAAGAAAGGPGGTPGPNPLRIEFKNGTSLEADFVIAAIGVKPDTRLATAAGLALGPSGGIATDEHMRTSDAHIYAVGDAVEVQQYVSAAPSLIALAGPANKQARIAADNICGIATSYKGTQGSLVIKVFGLTAAATGINEKTAKALGLTYDKVYFFAGSHAGYYPGAQDMTIKVLFAPDTGRILGAQLMGGQGVDKRCDVLAVAIRAHMTARDLAELELCYAPPFSSAKDPVNVAGYMIENLIGGKLSQYHWHDVATLPRDGSATILDVRTPAEYDKGHLEGAVNLPVDQLRGRLSEVEPGKPVFLICQSGLRSYVAARILAQHGFAVSHLCGGWRFYQLVR